MQLIQFTNTNEKKRSERRKHCALAAVGGAKKFRPAADPLAGGRMTAKT